MIRLINLSSIPWPLRLGEAIFTTVFHTVKDGEGLERHGRRTKQDTLEAAMKTAAEAFSNPFHDLYKEQIRKQLDQHYATVETRLREDFSKDFIRRNKVAELVIIAIIAILAALNLITNIQWSALWKLCKWILHIQ